MGLEGYKATEAVGPGWADQNAGPAAPESRRGLGGSREGLLGSQVPWALIRLKTPCPFLPHCRKKILPYPMPIELLLLVLL